MTEKIIQNNNISDYWLCHIFCIGALTAKRLSIDHNVERPEELQRYDCDTENPQLFFFDINIIFSE